MINKDHRRYFLVESGDILTKANAYRLEYNRVHKALWDYAVSLGGTAYNLAVDGGLRAVRFPEGTKPPYGFKHPDKDGTCRPRLHSKLSLEFAALPRMPDVMEYVGGVNPLLDVEFTTTSDPNEPTSKVPIGNPRYPVFIDWFSVEGPLLLGIPDQVLTCAYLKRKHPEVTFRKGEDKHDPNTEGLKEILLEEWDLMEARYRRGLAA